MKDLFIQTDYPSDGVGRITLNRPQAHNALCAELMSLLCTLLDEWAADDTVRAVIITGGSGKAFAAGADIKELSDLTLAEALKKDPLTYWDRVAAFPKPIIAAVNGVALGGGFELALATDIIIAADTAVFGLPELALGVIPGAGGTQRLARALGKQAAMALILTGEKLSAQQALDGDLVYKVVSHETLQAQALTLAESIAAKPLLAVMAAKKAVIASQEQSLSQGINTERQLFFQLFATYDQVEGMQAFIEKRPARFIHQ
jgi:enoyl-CoA hydratase/carnithine racemase